ncbi:MAG: hypothetical protein RLZZ546_850 [Bacteroidota bacterium]
MTIAIILMFIIGYLAIVFEHPLKLDKTVPALLTGVLCWTILAIGFYNGSLTIADSHGNLFNAASGMTDTLYEHFSETLFHHTGKISEILIFLICAMTIVELIDLHQGFSIMKDFIETKSKIKLLWISGIFVFFLSAIIDNLTAVIVIITILRKLIPNKDERLWYSCLAITAANAGGAWSPMGDVTTTMLWIGKKVSSQGLISYLPLPSLVCFITPYLLASFSKVFKGTIKVEHSSITDEQKYLSSKIMLWLGLGCILFVPIFKTLTHLPPYIGMILALAIMWLTSEFIHPEENFDKSKRKLFSVHKALSRIEISSILFFLGILLAVGALETIAIDGIGSLRYAAEWLQNIVPNLDAVVIILGFFSAIIDNVPLVAASMGMFTEPIDAKLWHFIAYSAGTGGSMLIIGSAAGVAAMGMEKINFIWYFKKITWLTTLGFLLGAFVFILQYFIFHGQ